MKTTETIRMNLDARPLMKTIKITKAEVAAAQAHAEVLLATLEECKAIAESLPPLTLTSSVKKKPTHPLRRFRKNS